MAPTRNSAPSPGDHEKLGDYEILRALKRGGMGEVLLARKRGAGGFEQLAAVKTTRSDLRELASVRAMFLDEARLLARLRHPVIAQVFDFGEHDGVLFLAMEYVAGVSFRELADLEPPPAICARAMAEVCRGLHAAHELTDLTGRPLGVVHRDVSPENLMMTFEGRIKVLDFGIALMRGREAPVTEFGAIKGKPPYLSPEQLKGEPIDRRTDVFAASVVLHELLTGQPVFRGDSVYAIAHAIEHVEVPPPSALAGPLPAGLDDIALRGLAREPDARYQTALAMAKDLDRVAGAASGEHLEDYAHGALADRAEAHRIRLARLLEQSESAHRPIGRSTGAVTALVGMPAPPPDEHGHQQRDGHAAGDEREPRASEAQDSAGASGEIARAVTELAHAHAPRVTEHAGSGPSARAADPPPVADDANDDDDDAARPPSRQTTEIAEAPRARASSPWRIAAVVVAAAAAAALALVLLSDSRTAALHPPADAARAPDAASAVASPPATDRSTPAPRAGEAGAANAPILPVSEHRTSAVESDEPAGRTGSAGRAPSSTRDAPERRGSRRPRRAPASDSSPPPTSSKPSEDRQSSPSPAVALPPPTGSGFVTITAEPYGHVQIDGNSAGPTPIIKRELPAGAHTVVVTRPDTGSVRLRRTIELSDGEHVRLRAP